MAIADMSTDNIDETTNRLDAFEQHVVLVYPSLGWWKGQYQLKDATVSVDNQVADSDSVTKPQLKLLQLSDRGKYYHKKFQEITSDRQACVERYSVPFPIDGVRIIPRSACTAFFHEMIGETVAGIPQYDPNREVQSVLYRLHQAADDFAVEYPAILEQAKLQVEPAYWNRVAHRVPKQTAIRSKFYLTVAAVRLASGNDRKLTHEELAGMDDFLRESLSQQVKAALEEMVEGPREQLAKAVTDLQELVARGGRVSSKSFNPIRQAIEKIRTFEFLATPELLNKISSLEDRMGIVTPRDLDQATIASTGLSDLMQEVHEEVASVEARSEMIERFGREAKLLDMSEDDDEEFA